MHIRNGRSSRSSLSRWRRGSVPLALALAGSAVGSSSALGAPLNLEAVNNVTQRTVWQGNVSGTFPNNRVLQMENFSTDATAATLGLVGRSNGQVLRISNIAAGSGVTAGSTSGFGQAGSTVSGTGMLALATATTGSTIGMSGEVRSANGLAGLFENEVAGTGATTGTAISALGADHDEVDNNTGGDGFDAGVEASGPNGVEGNSHTPFGFGVSGDGPARGVSGSATDANGDGGFFTGGASGSSVVGNGGVQGVLASGSTFGVNGTVNSAGATAINGTAGANATDGVNGNASSGSGDGVQGVASGSNGFGIFGIGSGATGADAGVFSASSGDGVRTSTSAGAEQAVQATQFGDSGDAIQASVSAAGGTGIRSNQTGDQNGDTNATNDGNEAINASTDDTNAPASISTTSCATSDALTCEALEAFGFVDVNGSARVTGTLTKGGGAFKIDHPLDPANKYLSHSFVESPDMKNIYDGIVVTNAAGEATVTLPAYFGALNRDFRYQLSVIGGDFAQAIVSDEIDEGGREFKIRTSKPNVKVSWQVTGIRKDAFANANRIKVEEDKTGPAEGRYLYPRELGKSPALGIQDNGGGRRSPGSTLAESREQAQSDRAKAPSRVPQPTAIQQGRQPGGRDGTRPAPRKQNVPTVGQLAADARK